MVVMDLRAVDVFPSRVKDPAVGERPRRVVVLQVGGELTDVLAVGIAAIDGGHLSQPALNPAAGPRGNKHDAAVRQVARLDVVVNSVGQLPQAGAIATDFVEVIGLAAALAVREDDPLAVIMHARVADRPLGIVHEHGQLAGLEVHFAQPTALAVARVFGVGREVSEVGVPVLGNDAPHGKDDLLHLGHWLGCACDSECRAGRNQAEENYHQKSHLSAQEAPPGP